ncbi:hypothetical protein [Sphaerothrix gracilis]|uniref:hypothetical protein n=1 Tax=Sphaerothrix gracilis TaxID=3151835 RepID=UPI0031FCA694
MSWPSIRRYLILIGLAVAGSLIGLAACRTAPNPDEPVQPETQQSTANQSVVDPQP